MSAVSKKLMPASSAACTTRALPASSSRVPKLLQPSPVTVTSSDPILRFSMSISVAGILRAARGSVHGHELGAVGSRAISELAGVIRAAAPCIAGAIEPADVLCARGEVVEDDTVVE